ncbi:MAG TPA: UPF0149 family protein [Xanthomonadales bacterium]|nr:UPF0149 family protein [Xanthomonadales bacterium]
MNNPQLPDFENSLRIGQGQLDAAELAECHGVLCGFLAISPQAGPSDYMTQLDSLQLVDQPDEALRLVLDELFSSTVAQLEDDEYGFRLWLPDDSEPLEERTEALARWCTGLLAGLASQGSIEALRGEAAEAVGDIEQIARAGLSAGPAEDEDAREDDERAFTEIAEYVRVVTLMLREDFRGPEQGEPVH